MDSEIKTTLSAEESGFESITVRAENQNLGIVTEFIDSILLEAGCDIRTQIQVDLCVEEIFVNIASYAYGEEGGDAGILAKAQDGVLTIVFKDSGKPYNPLERKDPDVTLSAEDRTPGGLGIYLVKKNTDGVFYEYSGGQNILTIKKNL